MVTEKIPNTGLESVRETPDIETASEDYATRFSGRLGVYFLSVQSRITLELISQRGINTILDVGGGHGQLYFPLTRAGYSVTVTGSSPVCKARLTKLRGDRSARFIACDLRYLPFANRSFDAVVGFRLMPHLCQWQTVLSEMCRVAKDIVVIDYPDIRSFNILYRLAFKMKLALEKNTRTFSLFDRNTIARQFRREGFEDIAFHPQFFMPMVAYRAARSKRLAKLVEGSARFLGLTKFLGSPVITRAVRTKSPDDQFNN